MYMYMYMYIVYIYIYIWTYAHIYLYLYMYTMKLVAERNLPRFTHAKASVSFRPRTSVPAGLCNRSTKEVVV